MKRSNLGTRAVSAVTLFSFTLTTLSPSLAWAIDRDDAATDVRPTERVTSDVAADAGKPGLADNPEKAVQDVAASAQKPTEVVKPSKDELRDAATSGVEQRPDGKPVVQAGTDQVAALPTGGDKSGVTSQSISVPKGSGTIQGMGESFSAQLSTGIATFSVPFALPAARGGAQPSLGLSYSSASGAGLAGMGWSVGVPYIARQTDRGLPSYDDRADWHPNQDSFVFNGGQELVPICTVTAGLACNKKSGQSALVEGEQMPPWAAGSQYFRPRVEGSFLRFFWSVDHKTWRVQDKSGITMELGVPLDGSKNESALETNPDNSAQIFRWHLVRQYDTYGTANPASADAKPMPVNVVVYKYFQADGQAYLSDIYDTTPTSAPMNTTALDGFAHHTHLEYDQRPDPTETYSSGWLIRQTRRLARVDVASKTMAGTGARRQVRRYHLDYDSGFHTSYLTSVQVEGRCGGSETDASVPAEEGGFLKDDGPGRERACPLLPPMTFEYTHTKGFTTAGGAIGSALPGYEAFDGRIKQVGGDPNHSLDEELSDLFDVDGDSLPDVLVTAPGVYGNDFGVFRNSAGGTRDSFGAVTQLPVLGVLGANSNSIKLSNANVMPLDIDADGRVDFVHMPKVKSYAVYHFERGKLVGEKIDAADQQSPKVDLGKDAAETKLADVNFDGMVDLVVSTGTEFQTFLSLGRYQGGYGQFGHASWAAADRANISNEPIRKCVPYSGTPVRFSDSDIQFADINGDGIQDIVRLHRGDVRYWPGRGNGFWGTGPLDECPSGTFSDKRYVVMDSAPYYSDIQGTSLRMDDVNGDGLDDLVQVRFDAIDVWLNVDGHGWTERSIIDGTVPSPSFANRVRLTDINGSGTRDVVWGNGKKYEYIDLSGGERPGLLSRVLNGLGKSTDIEYSSSASEMLAADRMPAYACQSEHDETGPFESPWCSRMPITTHVVKRVTESDNLSVAGSGPGQYVTEYQYRDPYYDGRQREFRGFRRARSKRIGDANSPTDFTESTFLLGECEDETPDNGVDDCSLPERWRDNPKEALKGLPVVSERYDAQGTYLSTEATTYRLRHLYTGQDGRKVRHAFQAGQRSILYDTAAATSSTGTTTAAEVQLETAPPSWTSAIDALAGQACAVPTESFAPSHATPVPLRATSGYAITESASYVDAFGNALMSIAKGCVDGDACLPEQSGHVPEGNQANEALCDYTKPGLPSGQQTGWLYRTVAGWARGSVQTGIRKETETEYNAQGAPVTTKAVFGGAVQLDRFHELSTRAKAPAPPIVLAPQKRVVGYREYDATFGNLLKEKGPDGLGRCRDVEYIDDAYAMFPTREVIYSGGCEGGVGKGPLQTQADYDRSLALVVKVTDTNQLVSKVEYDGFGRLTSLYRPRADGSEGTVPSVVIEYSLPSADDRRAYSVIYTMTQDGETEDEGEYLESYSFVDGMGRARVGLSEADPDEDDEHEWIVSSIAEFDAKGAVRRKYLPSFLPIALNGFPLTDSPPELPYGRQRYDAFGRQIQTYDVDGTVTLQSRYHALSTDLWDAADLYPGPHQGSYASTRTDGHGRAVETTERFHEGNTLAESYVRTQYLPTGEPTSIWRVRSEYPSVKRWMRYDTLGRMVLNVDPHTSGNFTLDETIDATPASGVGLKAWRYVYNDAGDLIGTSDARGCGQNFYYDGAGRLYGEDYSPCIKEHALYTDPQIMTASAPFDVSSLTPAMQNGLEVFYQFDVAPAAPVTAPALADGYVAAEDARFLGGRLVAVHDRAATTRFAYDGRGRGTKTWRKVSYLGAPQTTIAGRYVDRWYHQKVYYDAADRSVEQTTGVASPELQATVGLEGTGNKSAVRTKYTRRGTIQSVASSYGQLVKKIKRTADGLVEEMALGDGAETTTAMLYDSRRRLASVQTFRGLASLWSTAPPAISPSPTETDVEATHQLLLQDLDYSYDVVGNPTQIRDWRNPEEWPDGAKPATRRMEYDDQYRVTRVDYEYPAAGSDKFVSPFAAEINGQTDARRATPRGHKLLSKRPLWQTYKYDWLGNTTQTDDDQHVFYDRSLGTITPNTPAGGTARPYQMLNAAQAVTGGQHNGSLNGNVLYDAAGNVTYFKVTESTTACATSLSTCTSRFYYLWDELGRLVWARRIEGESSAAVGPYNEYLYDANDERVIKQAYYQSPNSVLSPKVSTLYIFDTLELRRAPFDTTTNQYTVDSTTEVGYLSANGMRLARLHYEPTGKGEPQLITPASLHASNLHVVLQVPDHLGSASMSIDHATGELMEARTYQPYGATESDYRPERWKGFREDHGFTGKEEDIEVGLTYFGKRFLSTYLGRWMSADPLAVHGVGEADLNLYAYVKGAVLKAVDPLGLTDATPEEVAKNYEAGWAAFQSTLTRLGGRIAGVRQVLARIEKSRTYLPDGETKDQGQHQRLTSRTIDYRGRITFQKGVIDGMKTGSADSFGVFGHEYAHAWLEMRHNGDADWWKRAEGPGLSGVNLQGIGSNIPDEERHAVVQEMFGKYVGHVLYVLEDTRQQLLNNKDRLGEIQGDGKTVYDNIKQLYEIRQWSHTGGYDHSSPKHEVTTPIPQWLREEANMLIGGRKEQISFDAVVKNAGVKAPGPTNPSQ